MLSGGKAMKRGIIILGMMIALIALLAAFVPAAESNQTAFVPRIHIKKGKSLNWSGYAIEYPSLANPQSGVVTDVKGTWVVPAVSSSGSTNTYSSAWVGIDGYSSNTVEQIGTEQDWYNGAPRYYAWYEMYPKLSFVINKPVQPGDTINAEVQYVKGKFQLTMTDVTQNWTFTTSQKSGQAIRSSAEWIMEAPWSGGVLPLADFGTITFSNASATINNHTGTISDPSWQYDDINMVDSNGNIKAQTSNLNSTGDSFDVTWKSSN